MLRLTLESFAKYNSDNIKIVIYSNGSDSYNKNQIFDLANKFNGDFFESENIIVTPTNEEEMQKNISIGHNKLFKKMQTYEAPVYLLSEEDWECTGHINYDEIINFFQKHFEIGQIRLRDFKYDDSLTGGSSINFITKEKIIWRQEYDCQNSRIMIGNPHWINSPAIVSRNALNIICEDYENELDRMDAFNVYYPENAQLFPGVYKHIGEWRVREDLRKKGLFTGDTIE